MNFGKNPALHDVCTILSLHMCFNPVLCNVVENHSNKFPPPKRPPVLNELNTLQQTCL